MVNTPEDVLSYWNYKKAFRSLMDNFERKKYVAFESTLLSRNEQDYLDYYLNKFKIRNRLEYHSLMTCHYNFMLY